MLNSRLDSLNINYIPGEGGAGGVSIDCPPSTSLLVDAVDAVDMSDALSLSTLCIIDVVDMYDALSAQSLVIFSIFCSFLYAFLSSLLFCFVLRVFIYNDQLLRGSLSINGEVERKEGLVGVFSMSLSAGRRREQQVDGRRAMPAPVSAELQIGRKRWRGLATRTVLVF